MNKTRTPKFELPRKLERILAALSAYYAKSNNLVLQRLLVNSHYHVQEEWTYDNWNGGTYGHALYFEVPPSIYYEIFDHLESAAQALCEGINRISNIPNEHIAAVFIELQEDPALENWRETSGALIHSSPAATISTEVELAKLWQPGYFRLFLSHKAEFKPFPSSFKESMALYGVSCFVAHEDIQPTKEWQDEIEKALFSMDALAALISEGFSNSCWTDQEIGVAIGRQIPIVPIKLGMDPYGFIGKYQALSARRKTHTSLAKEIYELLWTMPTLKGRLAESLVTRFESSQTFAHANTLMRYLGKIENAPPNLIERLEKAPEKDSQVAGAWVVQQELPGLLKRLRGDRDVSKEQI